MNIANAIGQKLQRVIFIDGEQRSGKSNLAKAMAGRLAYHTNATFNVNNVFFDVNNVIKYLSDNKGEIVILDEAAFDLMSTDWQKKDQQLFLKMLYTAAKNHHTLFILIPELSALSSKIVANGHALFRTYMRRTRTGFYQRGFFFCYDKKAMKYIYLKEKKKVKGPYPKPGFKGRCPDVTTKSLVIDEKEYEKNKDAAIDTLHHVEVKKEKTDKYTIKFYKLAKYMIDNKIMNKSNIAIFAGINRDDFKKTMAEVEPLFAKFKY